MAALQAHAEKGREGLIATILISIGLGLLLVGAVVSIVRQRKQGKCVGCGTSACSECPHCKGEAQ